MHVAAREHAELVEVAMPALRSVVVRGEWVLHVLVTSYLRAQLVAFRGRSNGKPRRGGEHQKKHVQTEHDTRPSGAGW
eukprot:1817900-Prymnesium_polylepis.1